MSGTCRSIQSELTFAHPAREVLDHTQRNVSVLMGAFNVRSGNFNINSYFCLKGLYRKMSLFFLQRVLNMSEATEGAWKYLACCDRLQNRMHQS